MSMLESNGTERTAGSRLMTYGGVFFACRWALIRCMKVVLPEPGRVISCLFLTLMS